MPSLGENRLKIYNLLYNKPLFDYMQKDNDGNQEINVLILGNGWVGNEAFKAVFWCGQYPDTKGYYVYDEVGKPIKIEQKKVDAPQSTKAAPSKVMTILLSLLCVLTVALGIFAINMKNKYNEQLKLQATISSKLEEQEKTISEQKADIDDLQTQLLNSVLDTSGITTAQELITRIENNEIAIKDEDTILKQLKDLVGATSEESEDKTVRFVAYTVKSGDSLTKICDEHKLEYNANKNIILSLNGITDPNSIFVGQVIILPVQ